MMHASSTGQFQATKATTGPFDLKSDHAYECWREQKLHDYPVRPEQLLIEVRDPRTLSQAERDAIMRLCRKANMVIYAIGSVNLRGQKDAIRKLGAQLGLSRLDSNLCADEDDVTSLRVISEGRHRHYIPYTNRPLSWHTDGYYNPPEHQIRTWVLHCVCAAATGGENALLDHEIAYIAMRDKYPEYIAALMAPDAMTIPPNAEEGVELRPEQTGPVFSVDPQTGNLHMRYTARKRNIQWKQDPVTLAAVKFLEELLASDSPYIFRHRLEPGQGIIANNVLHNRAGFTDGAQHPRLLYRARYYDRVTDTAISDVLEQGGKGN
jgi:alpha-ketoglutarate-dependent taurine dioxygenase